MSQSETLLHGGTANVDKAVPHTRQLVCLRLIIHLKRRRQRAVQYRRRIGDQLNLTSRQSRVFSTFDSLRYLAANLDYPFRAHLLRQSVRFL